MAKSSSEGGDSSCPSLELELEERLGLGLVFGLSMLKKFMQRCDNEASFIKFYWQTMQNVLVLLLFFSFPPSNLENNIIGIYVPLK